MRITCWCPHPGGVIDVSDLGKRRGQRLVLDRVSFTAAPGRVTAFLGANGAGKSSTLRILLGLDRATAGTALINGAPYAALRRPLTTVGALLEGSGAHRSRRGRDHLVWLARSNGLPLRRVDQALAQVGLTAHARRRVGRYSLGMSQRLGLAAALLGEPQILVLDEPTNGLDPDGIRWLRRLVRDHAASGGTVLLSSHLIAEMAAVADDIVVINDGRVAARGPVAAVVGRHPSLEEAFFALTAAAEPARSPGSAR